MGKFKPARGKKPMPQQKANAIGCITVLIIAFVLVLLMVYFTVVQK